MNLVHPGSANLRGPPKATLSPPRIKEVASTRSLTTFESYLLAQPEPEASYGAERSMSKTAQTSRTSMMNTRDGGMEGTAHRGSVTAGGTMRGSALQPHGMFASISDMGERLRNAARYGNAGDVAELLRLGDAVPQFIDTVDADEWTALHWAADKGHEAIVLALLEAGADPDAKAAKAGWTALHFASLKGFESVVEMLLAAGADVEAKDRFYGKTAAKVGYNNHTDAIRALLRAAGPPEQRKLAWAQAQRLRREEEAAREAAGALAEAQERERAMAAEHSAAEAALQEMSSMKAAYIDLEAKKQQRESQLTLALHSADEELSRLRAEAEDAQRHLREAVEAERERGRAMLAAAEERARQEAERYEQRLKEAGEALAEEAARSEAAAEAAEATLLAVKTAARENHEKSTAAFHAAKTSAIEMAARAAAEFAEREAAAEAAAAEALTSLQAKAAEREFELQERIAQLNSNLQAQTQLAVDQCAAGEGARREAAALQRTVGELQDELEAERTSGAETTAIVETKLKEALDAQIAAEKARDLAKGDAERSEQRAIKARLAMESADAKALGLKEKMAKMTDVAAAQRATAQRDMEKLLDERSKEKEKGQADKWEMQSRLDAANNEIKRMHGLLATAMVAEAKLAQMMHIAGHAYVPMEGLEPPAFEPEPKIF